jgi:ketosteroid isomerase-like protein
MRRAILILLGLGSVTGAHSRPLEQGITPTDEAAVRALEERDRLAVLNQDYQVSQGIWATDLLVNTPTNRIAPNADAVLRMKQSGQADYSSFERQIEELRVDGDIAIVMGAETVRPVGKAPLAGQTVQRRFTNVWKKRQGVWRMAARHVSNVCAGGAAQQ